MDDEIVQEVRRARLKILEEVGFDMDRLVERLMREQQEHPERLVSFPPPWVSEGAKDKETSSDGIPASVEAT